MTGTRPRAVVVRTPVFFMVMVALVASFVVTGAAVAQVEEQPAAAGPESELDAWLERHAVEGTTPEGALKLWFDAVFLYLEPDSRPLGASLLGHLTVSFKQDPEWERRPSNQTFVSRLRDPAYHHVFRSYAQGAEPGNGYAMDPAEYSLRIGGSSEDRHGRGWRVLLVSSGADNPRPVYLRQSTTSGLWYVDGYANVYVGIRPPASGEEEFR